MADHRFTALEYDTQHPDLLVVVCDCGWWDITADGSGSAVEAAKGYSEHVATAAAARDASGGGDA